MPYSREIAWVPVAIRRRVKKVDPHRQERKARATLYPKFSIPINSARAERATNPRGGQRRV